MKNNLRAGFTLIELLVVVAIITVLISILLPALGKAREAARAVVCSVHLRQGAIALNQYMMEWNGYMPGPNTSGYAYRMPGRPPTGSTSANDPIQMDDWLSPILGKTMSLPKDRWARLKEIFNNAFRCPSNTLKYDYVYADASSSFPAASELSYLSYTAPWTFHVYGSINQAKGRGQTYGLCIPSPEINYVNLEPANNSFRLDSIGAPDMKVAITEGARYVDTLGRVSFNANVSGSAWGANFMNRSPTLNCFYAETGDPYKLNSNGTLTDVAKKFAYRHSEKLNVAFFDGHVESLDNVKSRQVKYWFPSGSVILDPSGIGDKNVQRGTIVP